MLLQVCAYMIMVLIYIDRTALFIICTYFISSYYYSFWFGVCVIQYMYLICFIDIVSMCANKEI